MVVYIGYYNFTKFHQNRMKNKKVLLKAHVSVQNFKVSVELWKSYIVMLENETFLCDGMKNVLRSISIIAEMSRDQQLQQSLLIEVNPSSDRKIKQG